MFYLEGAGKNNFFEHIEVHDCEITNNQLILLQFYFLTLMLMRLVEDHQESMRCFQPQ
jgi:hypothetical protein